MKFCLEKIRNKNILKESAQLNSFNESGYFELKNKTEIPHKNNNKAMIL